MKIFVLLIIGIVALAFNAMAESSSLVSLEDQSKIIISGNEARKLYEGMKLVDVHKAPGSNQQKKIGKHIECTHFSSENRYRCMIYFVKGEGPAEITGEVREIQIQNPEKLKP